MTPHYPKPWIWSEEFAVALREMESTPRMSRAQEIEAELIALIPELTRVAGGRDFRPGGHGEEIVSGLMVLLPGCLNDSCITPDTQEAAIEKAGADHGPFSFRVIFGGESLFNIAVCRLRQTGIEAEALLPGLEVMEDEDGKDIRIKRCTWRLSFTLPYDWSAPQ